MRTAWGRESWQVVDGRGVLVINNYVALPAARLCWAVATVSIKFSTV